MITTGDVYCILRKICEQFGIAEIYDGLDEPKGEIKSERIVIRTGSQSNGKIWEKSFVNINFCTPLNVDGSANTVRLNEIERIVKPVFKYGDVVKYNGSTCSYENGGDNWMSREADTALKCHYVNVRILFEVLNVK